MSLKQWANRLKRDGVTLWFALRNPFTPWWIKMLIALVVAYALSPIDLIPDFIPVLGYLDDLILLPIFIWLAIQLLPPEVLAKSRSAAEAWLNENAQKPRVWWSFVPIVMAWLCLAGAVFYSSWR